MGENLFVPADTDSMALQQRIVEAIAASPDGSAVTGWAGLAWCGAERWFNGTANGRDPLPVPIALDDHRTPTRTPRIQACNDWLQDGEVIEVDGIPVTVPERSLSFITRRARSDQEAIAANDMAYACDLVDPASYVSHLIALAGRPGIRRARRAFGLAEENAWSPMESVMRVHWRRVRPAKLLCNTPLFDRQGRHLLTPDLLDPVAGIAGEYNGRVHDGVDPRRRDLDREDVYRAIGLEVVTMMSTDLRDTTAFERRLARAYRRERRPGERAWTLRQPDWWVDTSTVARRRALSQEERGRWLRGAA